MSDGDCGRRERGWPLGNSLLLLLVCVVCSPLDAADNKHKSSLTAEQRAERLAERNRQWQQARSLIQQGQVEQAIAAGEQALKIETELFGHHSAGVAFLLEWIAERHESRQALEKAQENREEILRVYTSLHGEGHWQTVEARHALAFLQQWQRLTAKQRDRFATVRQWEAEAGSQAGEGQFRQAMELYEKALAARRGLFGENHVEYAEQLQLLALCYANQRQHARAEFLSRKSLQIGRNLCGGSHPLVASLESDLAFLRSRSGDLVQAQAGYRRAVKIYGRAHGENSRRRREALSNLARVTQRLAERYERDRNDEAARIARREVFELKQDIFGEQHWEVTDARLVLEHLDRLDALDDAARQRAEEAESDYRKAIRLRADGKPAEALPVAERAMQAFRDILDSDSLSFGRSAFLVGGLACDLGKSERSLTAYEQAVRVFRQVLGERHPDLGLALNDLGALRERLGDLDAAIARYREACEIYASSLKSPHARITRSLDNLAKALSRQASKQLDRNDFDAARESRAEALAVRIKQHGEKHWEVTDARLELAHVEQLAALDDDRRAQLAKAKQLRRKVGQLEEEDKLDEAIKLLEGALAIQRRLLGKDHRLLVETLMCLGGLCDLLGKNETAVDYYRQAHGICETTLGREHPGTADCLRDLGRLLAWQGESETAKSYLERAVETYEKVLGDKHQTTVASRSYLERLLRVGAREDDPPLSSKRAEVAVKASQLLDRARELQRAGQMDEAIAACRTAVTLVKQAMGEESEGAANRWHELADMYLESGRFEEAQTAYTQAVQIEAKLYPGADWRAADARADLDLAGHLLAPDEQRRAAWVKSCELLRLADGLEQREQQKEAIPLVSQALEIRRKHAAESSWATVECLNRLVRLHIVLGQFDEACSRSGALLPAQETALGALHPDIARTHTWLGHLLERLSRQAEARPHFERAVDTCRQTRGLEHAETVAALKSLGSNLRSLKEHVAARRTLEEALQLSVRVHGQEHEQTALVHNELGMLCWNTSDNAGARKHFEEALAIYRKVYGGRHERTVSALQNLGDVLGDLGELSAAVSYQQQAIDIRRELLGPDHRSTLTSLVQLGTTYLRHNNLEEAERLFQEAAERFRRTLGTSHEDYAGTMSLLAMVYERQAEERETEEEIPAARKLRRKALSIREEFGRPRDPATINARLALTHTEELATLPPEKRRRLREAADMSRRSQAQADQHRFDDAIRLARQAVDIQREVFGPNHYQTAVTSLHLAGLHARNGQAADAEPLYRQVIEVYHRELGEWHPEYFGSVLLLANVLVELEKHDEALAIYEQLLAIVESEGGPRHEHYGLVVSFVVQLYQKRVQALEEQDDYGQAAELCQKILDLRLKEFGPDHWPVASARQALARSRLIAGLTSDQRHRLVEARKLREQARQAAERRDFAAALAVIQQAMATHEELLGRDHPDLTDWLITLGEYLRDADRLDEAQAAYKRALDISRKSLGAGHPKTAAILNDLGLVLHNAAQFQEARQVLQEALAIQDRTVPNSVAASTTMNNLALALDELGDDAAARSYFERAVEIREKSLGPQHPRTAKVLRNLGVLLQEMGEDAAAHDDLQQALDAYRAAYGEEHAAVATTLEHLGMWCRDQDDYVAARKYYEKALRLWQSLRGEDSREAATALQYLGNLLVDMQDYSGAISRLQRATEVSRRTCGDKHPRTAYCLSGLARALSAAGNYEAARSPLDECLAILRDTRGPGHRDTIRTMLQMASLTSMLGDRTAALSCYRQALAARRKVWGDKHPNTAATLCKLGSRYEQMGLYAEARQYLEEALQIYRATFGEEHAQTSAVLQKLGSLLVSAGDFVKGRRCIEQSLAIDRKLFGPKHVSLAMSLHNLGAVLMFMGSDASAQIYLEESLEMKAELRGPDHPSLCVTLNALGLLLRESDPEASRRHFERELRICQQQLEKQLPPTAAALQRVGEQLRKMNRNQEALPYFRRALDTLQKALGEEHAFTAPLRLDIGELLVSLEDRQAALPYYKQALEITRTARGERAAETAYYMRRLAVLRAEMDEVDEAQALLDDALSIYEQTCGPGDGRTVAALATAAIAIGKHDVDKARPYFEQRLEILQAKLGNEHPDTAVAHLQFAEALMRHGDIENAWDHTVRGVSTTAAIRARYLAASSQDEHRWLTGYRRHAFECLMNLAEAQNPLPPKRAQQLMSVLLDWKAGGGQTLLARQEALVLERDDAAKGLADELRSLRRQLMQFQLQASIDAGDSNDHRQVASLRARHDEVERQLAQRLEEYAALRQSFQAGCDDIAARLDPQSAVIELVKYRRYGFRNNDPQPGWGKPRYAALLLWPQPPRGWLDDYQQAVSRSRDFSRPLLVHFHARWAAPAFQMRMKVLTMPDVLEAINEKLVAVTVDIDKHTDLAKRYKVVAIPCLIAVDAGGRVLARHRGSVDKEKLLAWLDKVPHQEARQSLVRLGDAEPIETAIADWRRSVQRGAVSAELDRRLNDVVWKPLADAVPASVKRLYIAPDGELSRLPFEAIRLADGGYLIERFQVSYLSNGRDLMPRLKPPGELGPVVVLTDPNYDASPAPLGSESPMAPATESALQEMHFTPLPGFAAEAGAVIDTWKKCDPGENILLLEGDEASEERLVTLSRPRVLHLITHGFFRPNSPPAAVVRFDEGEQQGDQLAMADTEMHGRGLEPIAAPSLPRRPGVGQDPRLRSGLALAGANRSQRRLQLKLDDGLLRALEVQNLDLWGTQLVVLSACETGLGEVEVGEGVLGLRRAFQQAGAETVIASLWKVPDAETQKLMTRFFELWLSGKSRSESLRTAQMEMIRQMREQDQGQRRTAPPYFWAGFICHGQSD